MIRNKLKIVLLISLLLVFRYNLVAQHPIYRNIGINEGLPSSSSYFVANDYSGYIWIAGDLGLSKYDGKRIKNITASEGLPNSSILCLDIDVNGRVYLIAADGTLGIVENDTIKQLPATVQLRVALSKQHAYITSFKVDESFSIWIGTSSSLFCCSARDQYKKLNRVVNNDHDVFAIVKTIGAKSIASAFDGSIKKVKLNMRSLALKVEVQNGNRSYVNSIILDKDEGINTKFVSLKCSDGKMLFSSQNNLYECEPAGLVLKKTFSSAVIFLFEDKDRNLYVSLANGHGVLLFKKGNLKTKPDTLFDGSTIGSICQDFERGIWLSSTENGVYYIPYLYSTFYPEIKELNLPVEDVGLIDSTVYIATHNHKIISIDPQDRVKMSKPLVNLSNVGKVRIEKIDNNYYYCGGITARFNPKNLSYTFLNVNHLPFSSNDIEKTTDNEILYNAHTRIYKNTFNGIKLLVALEQRVNRMLSVNGQMYLGTRKGLYILKGDKLHQVFIEELGDLNVTSLCKCNNRLYVGTKTQGVFVVNKGMVERVINASNGLVSNYCSDIDSDSNGNIWISTNRGLCYFNQKQPQNVYLLNWQNGLNTNEIIGTCVRGEDLFIATKTGLIKYKLHQLSVEDEHARLNLTGIFVNDRLSHNAHFSYLQNNLRFVVNSISYKRTGWKEFAYQLVGFDKTVKATSNDYIEYSNLPAGKYVLMLSGIDAAGNHLPLKSYYSFEIKAPFWKKAWFYILCSLLLLGMIYVFIQWRMSIQRKKLEEKSNLEKIIYESQITAVRAQMNPHFIFNVINSIQDFVLKNETQSAYDYLVKFARLIRLVLSNSKQNYILLEKELEWLEIYVSLEQLRFKDSFEFLLKVDEDVDVSEIRVPTMLIQPYIENAIWHGLMPLDDKRNALLRLEIRQHGSGIMIVIEDNGVGRLYSQSIKPMGMHASMGMELINEKLNVLAKLNQEEIEVEVLDLYDSTTPKGTRVKILILSKHED